MKEQKILFALGIMDEKYIEEADFRHVKRKRMIKWIGIAAACLSIVTTVVLLGPPNTDSTNQCRGYDLIAQKLQVYFDALKLEENENTFDTVPDASGGSASSPKYVEVTDNQVAEVIESDYLKRSDQYAYYLYCNRLYVYSLQGKETKRAGSYTIAHAQASESHNQQYHFQAWQIFLSKDCKTVTVIAPYYDSEHPNRDYMNVISLDVSDVTSITEKKRITIIGSSDNARMVNGKLLITSNFCVNKDADLSDEAEFVPQIDCGEGFISIPAENIVVPEEINSSYYEVIWLIDAETLSLDGCAAFLSYGGREYITSDTVYFMRRYNETVNGTETSMCDIAGVRYAGQKIEITGVITVEGSPLDRYSLDERNGILRVVTETNKKGVTNANLYCIDFADFTVAAQLIGFAPEGEIVRSVRFEGDYVYVCTSEKPIYTVITDPVFFIDLSDLDNIKVKDTGTIKGFSTKLFDFGDGYLLGIGEDGVNRDRLKLEVYKETESAVEIVCTYNYNIPVNFKDRVVFYPTDYKSYFIDRENHIVSFAISDGQSSYTIRYLFFKFDGEKLNCVFEMNTGTLYGKSKNIRTLLIDGYLYIFSPDNCKNEQVLTLDFAWLEKEAENVYGLKFVDGKLYALCDSGYNVIEW